MQKPHLQIDAFPLVDHHFSGVGHYTLGIVRGFDELAGEGKLTYSLVVHRRLAGRLEKYRFRHCRSVIRNPLPNRLLNLVMKRGWRLPIDLLLGRGHYYFPSFASWPTYFSTSGVVIHDVTYLSVPECVEERNRAFLTATVPQSLKNSSEIISVSEFSKSEIVKYHAVDPDRVTVAYPSVDTGVFYRRSRDDIDAVRKKYGIASKTYILSVGNIEPRKNYKRLLDAYTTLPRHVADRYPLVIVGAGGWNNAEIVDAIAAANRSGLTVIHPQTFVLDEDMPALYSGAQFFVFVPLYEGFGMPPLESLACGTPAVVSGVASLPESVGNAASFVDPYSVDDIREKLLEMVDATERDREQFQPAIAKHLRSFSWRASAEITAACLSGLPRSHFSP